jgi:sensor c-di-GMP phosphodiesterase-like protein
LTGLPRASSIAEALASRFLKFLVHCADKQEFGMNGLRPPRVIRLLPLVETSNDRTSTKPLACEKPRWGAQVINRLNMMKRGTKRTLLIGVSIVMACAATLIPAIFGVYLAQEQAAQREHVQVVAFADAVIVRVQGVTHQAVSAVHEMDKLDEERCSPAYLEQVRRIAFAYRHIHDAGVYSDGHYLCSAMLGTLKDRPLKMPPADWHGKSGFDIWFDADNPFGATRKALLIGRAGSYVSMAADSFVDVDNLLHRSVAAIDTDNGRIFAESPGIDRAQMMAAWRDNGEMASDDSVFVVRKSSTLPLAVVISEPRPGVLASWRSLLSVWLLVGIVFGVALGAIVLRMLSRRISLQGELQGALRRREFVVHYQPIIALSGRRCVGTEALVRWRQGKKLVSPDLFIPFAESAGLIQQITDQVLEIVVAEMGPYLRRRKDLYVSINVSAVDLRTPRFLKVLSAKLKETGIAPSQIRIEATERGFMDADASRETIQAYRDAGHPVYIDDFGTGYSSLSYLQSFKVDVLKIDKSFVDTIGQNAASSSVAPHIVAMAHALGVEIVAEGIEHEAQAAFLREHGTQFGQGWLFAKAMPIEDFGRYLEGEVVKVC